MKRENRQCVERKERKQTRKRKLTPSPPTPLAVQHLDWRRPRVFPLTCSHLPPLPLGSEGRKGAGTFQKSAGRPQRAGAAHRGGVSGAARKSGGGPDACHGGAICTLETCCFLPWKCFVVYPENIAVSTLGDLSPENTCKRYVAD